MAEEKAIAAQNESKIEKKTILKWFMDHLQWIGIGISLLFGLKFTLVQAVCGIIALAVIILCILSYRQKSNKSYIKHDTSQQITEERKVKYFNPEEVAKVMYAKKPCNIFTEELLTELGYKVVAKLKEFDSYQKEESMAYISSEAAWKRYEVTKDLFEHYKRWIVPEIIGQNKVDELYASKNLEETNEESDFYKKSIGYPLHIMIIVLCALMTLATLLLGPPPRFYWMMFGLMCMFIGLEGYRYKASYLRQHFITGIAFFGFLMIMFMFFHPIDPQLFEPPAQKILPNAYHSSQKVNR